MNIGYKYIFKSEKPPNELTLHSFNSHLVEQEGLANYRTDIFGLELHLSTDAQIKKETLNFLNNLKFFDRKRKVYFNVKLLGQFEFELPDVKNGDIFDVSGIISYGVAVNNSRGKKGTKVCPLDSRGKVRNNKTLEECNKNEKSLKTIFLEKLEDELGIEINKIYFAKDDSFISRREDFSICDEQNNKISKISNLLEINLKSIVVKDYEKFQKVEFKQYGQRKSYGFGKFIIEKNNIL